MGAEVRADDETERDADRVVDLHLVPARVLHHSEYRDRHHERSKRSSGRLTLREPDEHQHRDDQDAASDAEQTRKHAGDEPDADPDQDGPHVQSIATHQRGTPAPRRGVRD